MRLEPLDPRCHFAVTGLDAAFGAAGTLRTGRTYDDTETALAITGAVYVEERTGGSAGDVVKYDDAGRIDTAFGTAGRAPVLFDITAMAYDKRTGQLYVGGTNAGTLFVERLTVDGVRDDTFGTTGIFRYTPGTPAVPGATGSAAETVTLDRLVALPRHAVLVGLDRQSFTDDDAATPTTRTVSDVAVMRIRANGTRDPAFGTHGVATVFSGTSQAGTNPQTGTVTGGGLEMVTFGDVVPEATGYRVVFARTAGTATVRTIDSDESLVINAGEQIKSQFLTTAGTKDDTQAFSWTLTTATTGSGENAFVPLLIADTGGTGVAVVGRTDTGRTGTVTGYALRPAHRPVAAVLPGSPNAAAVARSSRGIFYAGDDRGHVEAFDGNFTVDAGFARHGLGTTDVGSDLLALVPDADGRVLVFYRGGVIDRLL